MLERVLGVDDYDAATREQPRRKTAVVAMIGPELNLDWIDGGHPVQLAVDSGGFVEVDWIETDSVYRKLTVTADVGLGFHGFFLLPAAVLTPQS
jgi:hypothetical protein